MVPTPSPRDGGPTSAHTAVGGGGCQAPGPTLAQEVLSTPQTDLMKGGATPTPQFTYEKLISHQVVSTQPTVQELKGQSWASHSGCYVSRKLNF